MKINSHPVAALLFITVLLSGCSWFQSDENNKGWTAQRIYEEAKRSMNAGNYERAIQLYETLEARFPLGTLAQQAQLDIIYAYHKYNEPESAIVAADRFIKLHPRHPYLDYVYYLKGLVYFNQSFGLIERFIPVVDISERDQDSAQKSFRNFEELATRYPNSRYSDDARQRMTYLRNNLAKYELHVADFYMRREAYLAAARRAQYVLERYNGAPAVPDALAVMAEAYDAMDYDALAKDVIRVFETNYPNHPRLAEVKGQVEKDTGSCWYCPWDWL